MKKIILFSILLFLFPGCNDKNPTPVDPVQPGVEKLNYATGLISNAKKKYGRKFWRANSLYKAISEGTVPDTYDSRQVGCQMPIKDQGQCGSCYAVASTTTGEINYCVQTGGKEPQTQPWSAQAVVSCDTDTYGCGGGWFIQKFNKEHGFYTEATWPYVSGNGNAPRCDKNKLATAKPYAKPEDFVYLGSPDRGATYDEVTTALTQVGAVAVSFGADGVLNSYHDESQVITRCSGTQTNHEVTAIGYDKKTSSLLIQNSWGQSWGAKGYFRMKWGCNHLSEDAGYYIFKGTPCQPPKVHLPAEYVVNSGDDLTMAVKAEANVSYEWFSGTTSLGVGPVITVVPTNDAEYRLIAKSKCGEAEIVTLVTFKK